jgi:membrane protein
LIIISLCGIFYGEEAVRGRIFFQINHLVGNVSALQIQDMLKNMKLSGQSHVAIYTGVIILIVGASGVFAEIQDSINYIWGLKAKPKKGLMKYIKNRLISFSMIGVMSFLLLVSLIISALMDVLSEGLKNHYSEVGTTMLYILNLSIVFVSITFLFVIVYKTLPDGKVSFKDSLIGASFTSLLFMIGKFAIGAYLGNSTIASAYGTAGSIIILLAWVYYSAIILYFGAEFTKIYALTYGKKITPKQYSVKINKEIIEIEPKRTVS